MFDISLERFNDEFGFLTFPEGGEGVESDSPDQTLVTATSKGVVTDKGCSTVTFMKCDAGSNSFDSIHDSINNGLNEVFVNGITHVILLYH